MKVDPGQSARSHGEISRHSFLLHVSKTPLDIPLIALSDTHGGQHDHKNVGRGCI